MKHTFFFSVVALLMFMVSCGPAAEDRQEMHRRAKIFQDSIANVIRVSMEEAAAPGPNAVMAPAPAQATAPSNSANQTPAQQAETNKK